MRRRFEVIPGAQAQVDWGDEGKILAHMGIGKVYDGRIEQRLSCVCGAVRRPRG